MKRTFAIILCILTLSLSFNRVYAFTSDKNISDKNISKNIITLCMSDTLPLASLKAHGFDTVILRIPGIRNSKAPYNTDYRELRMLYNNISALEANKLNYVISFTTGPGFSPADKTLSIYKNNLEMHYYSKMVIEILKRYQNNQYFCGASIDFEAPDTSQTDYYRVQDYIISRIKSTLSTMKLIYNLHPLTFENNYKDLRAFKDGNFIYNLNVDITALTYPGYGTAYKTSCPIDKNSLLASFEKYKDYLNKNKLNTIITYTYPWVKNSDVMLQDSYEIFKMLNLKLNLCYGGSGNQYDLLNNASVLNVIDRHNK